MLSARYRLKSSQAHVNHISYIPTQPSRTRPPTPLPVTTPLLSPNPLSPLLPQIELPLRPHPHHTNRTNPDRKRKRNAPPRRPKHPRLARKMPKSNRIRPHAQIIKRHLVDVIRNVQAHEAGEKRPCAEGAGAQRGDQRGDFRGRLAGDGGACVEGDVGGGHAVVGVGVVEARGVG